MRSTHSSHMYSTYFAPRGRSRMYSLGMQIAQQYLSPFDKIIGVIGEPGSGKSALIKGMFPSLELTNDDDGVNIRPLPLLDQDSKTGFYTPHTYHLDIRFEMGFTNLGVLADAILEAVHKGKRVIVEHFDLIYNMIGVNADLLIGVGEEILITRPNLLGPEPQEIYDIVNASLPYRLMAHTAEDLCEYFIPHDELVRCTHGDVRHGFIMSFPGKEPSFDIIELEKKVQGMIEKNLPISYHDEQHVSIGGDIHICTGPRTHVRHTGQIVGFRLLHHFIYNPFDKCYLMVGCVGEESEENLQKLDAMVQRQQQQNDFMF